MSSQQAEPETPVNPVPNSPEVNAQLAESSDTDMAPVAPSVDFSTADPEFFRQAIRSQLSPNESFWRNFAKEDARPLFVTERIESARALVTSLLQITNAGDWPTLDDCIPKGSILEAVDQYFWDKTDIPRELPFFNVLHYVMAKLMQQGVEIAKGSQRILPDLWTIVLAPSGAGKTMTQKALAKAMGGPVALFPDASSSLQFADNLQKFRLGLFLRDEFAQFLKTISKDASMKDVRDYLLRTYDNSDIIYASTKTKITVERSAISILGYSPIATLTSYLTKEMLLDGFAQRFSFCVAERDDRPIVGDYDFDGLPAVISPLWNRITSAPFHSVYHIDEAGRQAYDKVVQLVVTKAREEGIDDSFSRRLAFNTYKYGLAYHVLTGKKDNTIHTEDLIFGAKLTALHLFHLRKVLDLYGKPKPETSSSMQVASNTEVGSHLQYLPRAKEIIDRFAAKGEKTDARKLAAYVKQGAEMARTVLAELATDPQYAQHIELPKRK